MALTPKQAKRTDKSKGGAPRTYDRNAIVKTICDLVAQKHTLNQICKMEGMPSNGTLREWFLEDSELAANYACARELRADARADRIDEIVSMTLSGEIDATAARVAIDAEKWLAGKEMPKRYGDKIEQTFQNPDGTKLDLSVNFISVPINKPE